MTIPAKKPRSPIKIVVWLLLSSLTVVLLGDIWISFVQSQTSQDRVVLAVYFILLLGTLLVFLWVIVLAVLSFRKSADPQAALTITPVGINDQLGLLSVGLIGWDELTDVRIVPVWPVGGRLLVIDVKHPQTFIADRPLLIRRMVRRTAKRYGSPVVITQAGVAMDLTELREHILASRPGQP